MSKRFTDNAMWNKKWFRALSASEKCAWYYIKDECDNVGVWVPDFDLAEFQIGESVDWENLPGKTNGNIEVLPNGKWFLVDFCAFQYGTLKSDPKNKPHQSYLKLLDYHGLTDRVSIDYEKPINTHKDKDKDQDTDKDIPAELLKIEGFAEAWRDWSKFRKEIKKELAETTIKAQFKKLAKMPDPVAVIRQSIENGWQGLFEIKPEGKNGQPKQSLSDFIPR